MDAQSDHPSKLTNLPRKRRIKALCGDSVDSDGTFGAIWSASETRRSLFSERNLDVRIGWSRNLVNSQFADQELEQMTCEVWESIVRSRLWRPRAALMVRR